MKQTFESLNPPRRFYSVASVTPVKEGFALQLDGRTARTPGGHPIVAPTADLAELIAAEWNAQGERIVMAAMPATRLAHTAIDGAPDNRPAIVASIAEFAGADLICYFAEGPAILVARQKAAWVPLLEWARRDLGLAFERTAGVVHRDQPAATLELVQALAAGFDDFRLAGVALAAQLFGSAILALALAYGRLGGGEAFCASQIDDAFQAEQWGEDAEASIRTKTLAGEAAMLEAWFAALNSP